MIKQIYVCECDICGTVVPAKALQIHYNEENYVIPDGWFTGHNKDICICPECHNKLSGSKAAAPTYISNVEAVPVYGCPTVVLDNIHDALLSNDVKTATNPTEITIDEIAVTDVKKSKDFLIQCVSTLKEACTHKDNCNNCILQSERRCILADYDICDWNRNCVLDHLDTNELKKEHDAAQALINYCNTCSCDNRSCLFSDEAHRCICSQGLPENWDLRSLGGDESNE